MSQRLILPINRTRITAGYKNSNYRQEFGYTHYGCDLTDSKKSILTVWGSGKGKVTHCGYHPTGGNVIVVVYKECELPCGKVMDIAMRYFHLEKIYVKVGQEVTKDTKLALYGNTGASNGVHLHIELDNDVLFPNYTPQTSKSNEVLKKGIDTTLNPVDVLWCKTTAPDNQSVISSGYNTVSSMDLNYKTTTKC